MKQPSFWLAAIALACSLGCSPQALPGMQPAAPLVRMQLKLALKPQRQLLGNGMARAWQPSDVQLLRVKLLRHDGLAYVDAGLSQDVNQNPTPAAGGVVFLNMAAGQKYRAQVEAWGDVDASSANIHLNANHPAQADFDFTTTNGEDLGASRSATLNVQLDDVPFSAWARIVLGPPPNATHSLEAQLWEVGQADPVATLELSSSSVSSVYFSELRAGPFYEGRVIARDDLGASLAEGISPAFRFDPAATALETKWDAFINF